ncbi:LysR family transcriptional regulator [uncultured Tateyamaria sp.]|uniref:LysR family transcriptional regulator n=1 Tax=uncultured Tateyamaria sp. TaxID=455651 RepID=UPI00260BB871|nr:LysR family transcriptional regulator [uncultured Tateyamaria sp.]
MNAPTPNLSELNQPLLFEMIRSFTTLAETLNLSHAVTQLNSTRQTVRRHISQLEAMRGEELFRTKDRRYELTEAGEAALPEARELLMHARVWSRGQTGVRGALQYLQAQEGDWVFYQQQRPLGDIWRDESVLLRETYRAWVMASGEIESSHLSHVRPYLMVYRNSDSGWICVEFGNCSAYVNWFGQDYARSSIGRPIARLPAGEEFGRMLDQSFLDIETTQMARLDHVYTRMPQRSDQKQATMAYQRLMMAGFFPDRSPAVMTLVVPTINVKIAALDEVQRAAMTNINQPDFDPVDAKFERMATMPT